MNERWPAVRLGLLAAGVLAGYLALVLSGPLSANRAQHLVDAGGGLASLGFVFISASLTLVSFPAPLLAAASGLLFGTAAGSALSLAAATLGATAAHQLSRRALGRHHEWRTGSRFAGLVARLRDRSFSSVLYARVLPAMPFAFVSYAAGLAAVPLRAFVPATLLGAAPRAFAYAALGGHLGSLRQPQALIAVGLLVALALAPLALGWRRRSMRRP